MKKLYDALLAGYKLLGIALVVALMAVVTANIVFREVFAIALVWSTEVALAMFVWIAFLGAGIAFAENARIRFTFFADRLPPAGRNTVEIAVTYVGFALLFGLFVTSIYVGWVHRRETFTTMPVSVAWQWAAVPAGLVLGLIGWVRNGAWTYSQAAGRQELKLVGT